MMTPHAPLTILPRLAGTLASALALCSCSGSSAVESGSESATTTAATATEATEATEATATTEATGTSTATETETATTGDPSACWSDLAVGGSEVLYEGFPEGTEGITFGADGLLYTTTFGVVWRIDPAGTASEFAAVPTALGLAPWGDAGELVVASFGVYNQPDGAVYTVSAEGEATLLTVGIDSPNFVTIAADGSALISDDFDTRVFRVTAGGELTVVIEDVPSPNGMAYSPDGSSFYVASTFTDDGQLTRYDVDGEGMPIESSAREIMHLGIGSTPDGIAVDADNRVYVAANLRSEIWRVDGGAEEVIEGELVTSDVMNPASLAFGVGPAYDPCSIYVTELDGARIVRVAIGTRGAELYR